MSSVDFFRFTDEDIVIQIPALKRPTFEYLQKITAGDIVESIESDNSNEGPVTLRFSTVLRPREFSIGGKAYLGRTKKFRTDGRILGFQHYEWLLANQDTAMIPDQKVHTALNALLGEAVIEFSGIIAVCRYAGRSAPLFCCNGKKGWGGHWSTIGRIFDRRNRIAVSNE